MSSKSRSRQRKEEIEAAISARLGTQFGIREKEKAETITTGVTEVDELTGGIPRGHITEIFGQVSSGRTSLFLSILAAATDRGEACSLVDASDSFDPASAASAGIDLDRVLWIRCAGSLEHALRAADLLLHAGGFGVVVLDLGDLSDKESRRIPQSYWFRFRRAVEHTPTALIVITQEGCTKSCADLALHMTKEATEWSGSPDPTSSHLLTGLRVRVERRRPALAAPDSVCFEVKTSYAIAKSIDQPASKSEKGKRAPKTPQ